MNKLESKSSLKLNDRKIDRNSIIKNVKHNNDDDDDGDDDANDDDDDDEWWASDSGSSTGSYYSDSDSSSSVEWEAYINPNGEVFYIESCQDTPGNTVKPCNEHTKTPQPELMRRRSTRAGKLMRLIRKRESKRYSSVRDKKTKNIISKQNDGNHHKVSGNINKEVKFQDYQAGEIREVMLWIDPDKRHKLGRRATLCEAYLGIIPGNFSDKIRIMVGGFIPDGEAIKNKNIKIGDWLRSINSRDVTINNIEYILSDINNSMSVKLELQRVAGIDVTTDIQSSIIPKQSPRVKRLIDRDMSKRFIESLMDYSFGIIYLETSGLSECGHELQGVKYTYPRSQCKTSNSILCTARGAFITLNHMLPDTINSKPLSTTISVGSEKIHILYMTSDNDELLLLAIPDRWYSIDESYELLYDIKRTIEFSYQSLNNCFNNTNNHDDLDHLFYLIFTQLLYPYNNIFNIDNDNDKDDNKDTYNDNDNNLTIGIATVNDDKLPFKNIPNNHRVKIEFECIIGAVQQINLPRDAQIQIDAALNEMEAMDYRDWNDDPMDCQRLYTILGTCLYHKSYLLSSHLYRDDLIDVHSYLRQNGILNIIENETIKSLVIWRSVYPKSCHRGIINNYNTQINIPNGKWFILIVGFGNELLASILECGGCTAKLNDNIGPDIFYVEEAQETLKHIQKIGISTLAEKWILSNAKPEIIDINERACTKSTSTIAENLFGLIKSSDNSSSMQLTLKNYPNTIVNKKLPEVTSILKKRSPDESPVMSGSVYSLQTSEDSISQGTGTISEMSDEAAPILGRRAAREKNHANIDKQSDDSDNSDVELYRNDSQTCSMDVTDIRENILNQAEFILPMRLTAGEKNCLLHYVHLDSLEGILLSSRTIDNSDKNSNIITIFNECAHNIHRLLNNSVNFKKMLNDDNDTTAINKNLIAIKEHGVLFDYDNITFWVVGRLFLAPHVKEFYVCYEDCVAQNLIEMAFRLHGTWN